MRCLATLDEPTHGSCWIDGINVSEYPEKARQLIGFMPDNLPTHRDMTVGDYLDFYARAFGLRGKHRKLMVAQVQEFTQLNQLVEKPLNGLSKGMKQRVSLARALIHDPKLLIMDEPANGLDPRARIELRELTLALAARGKAVLISSHILSELEEVIDGAAIIEKGRLIHAGTMAEIGLEAQKKSGSYRRIAVRVRGAQDGLRAMLLEDPRVHSAELAGGSVEIEVNGDEDDCCNLLADLLGKGFRVLEFKQVEADLERLFMDITKGEVQ
jgi:ABC-2 type transport system ATP-binding protein